MNILYVLHTDGLAGANRSLLQLIRGITEADDSIHVYAIVPIEHDEIGPRLEELGCKLIPEDFDDCTTVMHGVRQAIRYYIKFYGYSKIYRDIKDLGINIVHTNTSVCDLGAYLAAKLGIPHVWHIRENMKYYSMSVIRPFFYKNLMEAPNNTAVCISHYIEDYIRGRYRRIRSAVIYDSFDIPDRSLHTDTGVIGMMIAGIIVKNKGIADAIEALNILVNREGISNLLLYIAGTDPSTAEYETVLRAMVHRYRLEGNVEFIPFLDSMDRIRSGCEIALQCSIMEGLGRVTIEGMIDDLLVIGARSGATKELIIEGYNGWMYEPGDYVQLAKVIKSVIELTPQEKERIRQNAYKWACDNFSIEATSAKILSLYRDIDNE